MKERAPDQLSARIPEVQRRLAVDVMREHISQISGEDWADDDIDTLRSDGQWRDVAVARGTGAILRWWDLALRDPSLDDEDRRWIDSLAAIHLRRLWRARADEGRFALLSAMLRTAF